ncbi:hypothetical protein QEG98_19205 [Myxococcus sp. MxC21-1]|nr:hypothetical protein QEG98_19205 [Myxococcus sp. MxC21-1]
MSGSGEASGFVVRAGASASTVCGGATVTVLVKGSQSNRGLSMTAAGIVCVMMRSITWTIIRCFSAPVAASE